MRSSGRQLDERQASRVLRRAAALQVHAGGLSLGELERVAAEAGIDALYVRRALEELDRATGSRARRRRRFAAGARQVEQATRRVFLDQLVPEADGEAQPRWRSRRSGVGGVAFRYSVEQAPGTDAELLLEADRSSAFRQARWATAASVLLATATGLVLLAKLAKALWIAAIVIGFPGTALLGVWAVAALVEALGAARRMDELEARISLQLADEAPPPTTLVPVQGSLLLGRFEIERALGRGGMADVYVARDRALGGERVALKIFALPADVEGAHDRFRNEVVAARRVNHPNVVRMHDLFEHEGRLLLSMEYFEGCTLAELVTRGGPMPLEEARSVLCAVARGLEAAHDAGVIHRDLKPANVLVGSEAPAEVKLIDFGLAKASFLGSLTGTGAMLGTPGYMSPEQARGRPVDARSDVYALGAVAYFALTGQPPFRGDDPLQVVLQHAEAPAPHPRLLRLDLPEAADGAIVRALAKRPDDRFPTARALGEALAIALATTPATP